MTSPAVTLIVPCFNEELNVASIVARLEAMNPSALNWEVVIVDDGSSDGTAAVATELSRLHPWLNLVRHPWNLGLGAAIRSGFRHARGEIICTIDSDCSMAPERLPDLVRLIEAGAAVVTASPWLRNCSNGEVHPLRRVMSRTCALLYRLVLRSDLTCYTALMRAYRRDALQAIQPPSNGFIALAEMLVLAQRSGYRVEEVAVRLDRRIYGDSKIRVVASICSHLGLLCRIAWKAWHHQHQPAVQNS